MINSEEFCTFVQTNGQLDTVVSYINNSLYLARKYAQIFVREYYMFREAHSFLRPLLEENARKRKTVSIFLHQMEAIVFTSNIFRSTRNCKSWRISWDHVTHQANRGRVKIVKIVDGYAQSLSVLPQFIKEIMTLG